MEQASINAAQAISAAVVALNIAYDAAWSLPDERLQAVMQALCDTTIPGSPSHQLDMVFGLHQMTALGLNQVLDSAQVQGQRAKSVAGREYTVEEGLVILVPIPLPDSILDLPFPADYTPEPQ